MEKRNYIPAPIDNKNLVEDAFEDATEIFGNFYEGRNHRENGKRHMVGFVKVYDEEFPKAINAECYVDATWVFGGNKVFIEVIGVNPCMDSFDEQRDLLFDYYEKQFKSWENEQNVGLRVEFKRNGDILEVRFYFDMDDPNL